MEQILTSLLPLLAQAEGAPPSGGGGSFLIMMVLFMAGMWFLLLAPQKKREKQHRQMLSELKAGDKVVTMSGFYGTIKRVKEDRFQVQIADDTVVEIAKSFIQHKVDPKNAESAKK